MKPTIHNKNLRFVYDLAKAMGKDNLNYVYKGQFSQNIIVDILSLTEKNIVKAEDPARVRKKVYNLMVECLQNITKHQAVTKVHNMDEHGIFLIQDRGDRYYITTGNLIKKEKVAFLREKLEMVNSLDKEALKEHYREQLLKAEISDKGGAGLGFIDMARKSGNKLHFNFQDFNDELSYFYFRLQISVAADVPSDMLPQNGKSLKYITDIHNIVNQEEIVLIYNNVFSEQSRLNLLTYLQSQLADSVFANKEMYNVMVEMLSNIVQHGTNRKEGTEKKPAIFFISETPDLYILNSGNFILSEDVPAFKKRLDKVNDLDKQELDDLYKKKLKKGSKLGIIDMRMKSITDFEYSFQENDQKYSYFTLQIEVTKD
jgi:hypothetical protein